VTRNNSTYKEGGGLRDRKKQQTSQVKIDDHGPRTRGRGVLKENDQGTGRHRGTYIDIALSTVTRPQHKHVAPSARTKSHGSTIAKDPNKYKYLCHFLSSTCEWVIQH
jgi:hypothetical protein